MSSNIVERHQPCPSCPSSDAYCIYDDGHGYCFSCNYFKPAIEEFNPLSEEVFTYEYIPLRGINKSTLKFYDIKTKIDKEGKPVSIGFRYPNSHYKVRSLVEKSFTWSPVGDQSKTGLFGRDKFDAGSHKYITITEGEIDALSLYQVLQAPVVSVQSATTAHRDCVAERDFLAGFERIYLAFDNDASGDEALHRVAKLFDPSKVYVVKFNVRKDANEYLQAGEDDTLKSIWWNSKPYTPKNVITSFSEFEEILKVKATWGFPYPFPTLTDMTYGIRPGEVVLLAAQEKVGKTSIMREILYKLLKGTDHAVGAFFLEENRARVLQALAGRELQKPVHLPDSGVDADQLVGALRNVVVSDGRLHLYSHFGNEDPDVLLDTIRFIVTGYGVRYVLFDHIGMAVIGRSSRGGDERAALEYLGTRLKLLANELGFAIILVSHMNDYGQTRGSHYLTKVADITIQAMRNPLALDEKERNTIYLQIPFNRYAPKSGFAGALRLNTTTHVLEEVYDVQASNDNFPTALGTRTQSAA